MPLAKIEGGVEKEKKNYEVLDEFVLSCSNCNKKLLNIVHVKNSDDTCTVLATCPFCGDKSWVKHLKGQYIYAAHDNLSILDIDVEMDDKTVTKQVFKIGK